MFIDDITSEKKHIGSVIDNITREQFDIKIKKGGDFNGHPEYRIDFVTTKSDLKEKNIGYLKFVPALHSKNSYAMSALKTDEDYRGQSISNMLLETLFQYSEFNNSSFDSSVQQRKPLTAFILQKYGFEAIDNRPRDAVEVLGRYKEADLMIAFRDKIKKREFEASNLCTNSQQYKVVDRNPALVEDTITLLTPYMLIDETKCKGKRDKNLKRFTISFYI